MRSRFPVALIRAATMGVALVLAAGCSSRSERSGAVSASLRSGSSARLYQFIGGELVPVRGPSSIASRILLPWTVQDRVADLAFLGNTLWLAINGRGLASFTPAERPEVQIHYDSLLFEHRTITTLLPSDGRLLVHLYYNAMLNTVLPDQLRARGVSLLLFSPSSSDLDYSIIVPPIQAANRDWEAVGFVAVSPRELLMEWKLSGEETHFAWTWFQLDERLQSAATRELYRSAMAYLPARDSSAAPAVRRAVDAAVAAQGEPGPEVSFLFPVRDRQTPRKVTRRLGAGDRLVTMPVFVDSEAAAVLLPDARVLLVAPDATTREVGLPLLPEGFQYTDLARHDDWLVIPWEQARFTDVGAAGLLAVKLAP